MRTNLYSLTLGLMAAVSFSVISGCQEAGETTSVSVAGDHEDDHGHDHGKEHESHDHEGHDHEGHDHGEHEGHDHGEEGGHGHDHGTDGDHDHGHSHDFTSIGDALKEIESLNGDVKKEFDAKTPEKAHGVLHHLFEVLVGAEELVKKMDDSEAKKELAGAVDSLLDDFTEVDATLHGDGSNGKPYGDVSDSIQESIAVLKKHAGDSK